MRKATLMFSGLMMMILIHSCSKSVNPSPDPVVPPVDSTNLPDDGSGDQGGDQGGEEGGVITPITKTYSFMRLPILDGSTFNSLYLGAIISATDNENLISPAFVKVDDDLRNPVTMYTDFALDVDPLENVMASKATDNLFFSHIKQAFDKGVSQFPSLRSAGAAPFENRFNSLRGIIGINEDVNELFDLGFADTTRLAEDKGRVILSFEVIKANVNLQVPITPFLSIDNTDKSWLDLFGSEKEPEILASIMYGENAFLIMESDSSTDQLIAAVKNCFKNADDIVSGAAFNSLSEQERKIIESATAYGYSIGNGSFPHGGKDAIIHYEQIVDKAADTHDVGKPIYYGLSNINTFISFINKFDVDEYTQKIRD